MIFKVYASGVELYVSKEMQTICFTLSKTTEKQSKTRTGNIIHLVSAQTEKVFQLTGKTNQNSVLNGIIHHFIISTMKRVILSRGIAFK